MQDSSVSKSTLCRDTLDPPEPITTSNNHLKAGARALQPVHKEDLSKYNKQPNRLLTCVIKVLNTQGNVIRRFSLRVEVG